ncbi:MAG: hypothetical protein ACYTDT_01895 [Planctomycetota bacterium]|jgi:hypothetical protein
MSKKNRRAKAQQLKQAKQAVPEPAADPINGLAHELFKRKGGIVLQRNLNLIHKTLQYHDSQMDRLNAGEDIKLLLTPFVALRYMKELERLNVQVRELLDECEQLARQQLTEPNPAAASSTMPTHSTSLDAPASSTLDVSDNTPQAPPTAA